MSHAPAVWFLPRTKINALQQYSIKQLVELCKHAHFVNVRVRINGKWCNFQADWIKHLEQRPVTTGGE